MRCKCCDALLTTREALRKKSDGSFEDLCSRCGLVVFLDLEDLFVEHREYAHGELTESILRAVGYEQGERSLGDTHGGSY